MTTEVTPHEDAEGPGAPPIEPGATVEPAAGSDAAAPADEPFDDARLMSHAYDGIREYDNPLPGWWNAIYIGSIVFAVVYIVAFHGLHWLDSPAKSYQAALGEYDAKKEIRERAEAANVSEAVLARGAADPKLLGLGQAVFVARCASCHAEDGRGLIGPNLTDLHQLHGVTRMDLYGTISRGVPGTAMLAWSEQLAQPDVVAVAAFVASIRGQNLEGKAPQGTPVEKFTAP